MLYLSANTYTKQSSDNGFRKETYVHNGRKTESASVSPTVPAQRTAFAGGRATSQSDQFNRDGSGQHSQSTFSQATQQLGDKYGALSLFISLVHGTSQGYT